MRVGSVLSQLTGGDFSKREKIVFGDVLLQFFGLTMKSFLMGQRKETPQCPAAYE